MSNPFAQITLLVSSPNAGGIALVANGNITLLDTDDTTGIWIARDTLFRNVIIRAEDAKTMQLQSFSAAAGKVVLIEDASYDFHDILFHEDKIYLVSTGTNKILVLAKTGKEIRRYDYPGECDSWHINCLGLWDGRVVLSAFGEFGELRGYKNGSKEQGFIIDIESNRKLWEGLSQPHTPIQHGSKYYVCNSEAKQVLVRVSQAEITTLQFDGYTRGIAFGDRYMYVGLSQSRNITVEDGNSCARIVAVSIFDHAICGEIHLPFQEIYDIRVADNDGLYDLPITMLSLNGRELEKKIAEYSSQLAMQKKQFLELQAQARRVTSHPVARPVIRFLRWAKRDPTFGDF